MLTSPPFVPWPRCHHGAGFQQFIYVLGAPTPVLSLWARQHGFSFSLIRLHNQAFACSGGFQLAGVPNPALKRTQAPAPGPLSFVSLGVSQMLEFIFQIAFELIGELLIIYGAESLIAPFRPTKETNRVMAFVGLFVLSVAASLLLSLLVPQRLFPVTKFHGSSLLVAPPLVGLSMYAFGNWRSERGKATTTMATFWGGAFYSFVFALTRIVFLYLYSPNA